MKSLKASKGITLVALVIIIIILLILAGISISALTNQGLFGRANDAKIESEIANIKEQIALDIYEKQLEPPVGSITDAELETILGKYGTVNKEDGTIVGITTAKGYEILLKDIYGGETVAESVPDGAAVMPINDITTWLKTGGISKEYSYTTIEQVIADSTCTESLMNNENAMKYLARSTEFADAICESETAMTDLGQSTYVDDTVLNSDYWSESICCSTYFESVLNVKVPTMTSNTKPYGEAYCYDYLDNNDNYNAYAAFNESSTTGWIADRTLIYPNYVGYKFEKPVCVKKVNVRNRAHSAITDCTTKEYKIRASQDKVDWEILATGTNTNYTPNEVWTIELNNNMKYYHYYELYIVSTLSGGTRNAQVQNLQFYGRTQ